MLAETRHVCLDKDGTLTDVHRYWAHTSSLRAERIRERFGLPAAALPDLLAAMGVDPTTARLRPGGPVGYRPRAVVVAATLAYLRAVEVETTAAALDELFAAVDRHQQLTHDYRIAILPGVREFLDAAHRRGLALSVFSSDRRENTLAVLGALGIDRYFGAVIGGGCVRAPKPEPDGFLAACARSGVGPRESVYVGDSVDDLVMAAAGGACRAIGVATGVATREELSRHSRWVCGSLDELLGGGGA